MPMLRDRNMPEDVARMENLEELARAVAESMEAGETFTDFLDACRTGSKETAASFEYGARLTEFTLLGNLAQHAGVGHKVQWNGAEMKASNLPELGRWVACPHRKGWPA